VLSSKLAQVLDAKAGDTLTVEFLEDRRQTTTVKVSRIIDEPLGVLSYMRLDALAALMQSVPTASGAWLQFDPRQERSLFRALKAAPAVGSVNLREATLQSFLASVAENIRINTTVLIGFACVIAVGIVYNAARIALSEHALELASLRILGFTRQEVAALLLGEQALLVLCAVPLGCALGYALAALLSHLLSSELFRLPLVVSRQTWLVSAGAVVLASIGSGWLVWRRLRGLDLIEVLKTRE
jgi:putative ABC transport system permease protein